MTVKELIEKLSQFKPETMVVIPGYEGGVSEVSSADLKKILVNKNTEWYYGPHEVVADDDDGDIRAILLNTGGSV